MIIQDQMAKSFDKEAAEERVAARNEELLRLQTQIAEREAAFPLRERIREIFKKYGVTAASIFLVAGITIGAVVGAITNALKAMGKQLANGLKTVGANFYSCFCTAWANRSDRQLPFQNCRRGNWISSRAHLVTYSRGGSFHF